MEAATLGICTIGKLAQGSSHALLFWLPQSGGSSGAQRQRFLPGSTPGIRGHSDRQPGLPTVAGGQDQSFQDRPLLERGVNLPQHSASHELGWPSQTFFSCPKILGVIGSLWLQGDATRHLKPLTAYSRRDISPM